MRLRLLSLAVLVVVVGCADEPTSLSRPAPSFAAAASGPKTWVVLGSGNSLPAELADYVAASGGALTGAMAGIGVAVATSDDPDFARKMGKVKGVHAVVEDVVLDFGTPTVSDAVEISEAGEPDAGQTAVGAVETFRALQWAPDAISAPAAWDAGFQGQGARVAIIDGGIRNTHIDIAPNLDAARSASFVPGQPYNFDQARNAQGQCVLNDTFWHGTHVAGSSRRRPTTSAPWASRPVPRSSASRRCTAAAARSRGSCRRSTTPRHRSPKGAPARTSST